MAAEVSLDVPLDLTAPDAGARLGDQPIDPGTAGNDFNFDSDRFGVTCPFHAQIRRANPRGHLSSPGIQRPALPLDQERQLRIARRGVPDGDADDSNVAADPATYPQTGVGLLFMSFQSRPLNFESQQGGSDANDFPMPGVGLDAFIGRAAATVAQHWYGPAGLPGQGPQESAGGELPFTIATFVTLKGGDYFYAPPLSFLRALTA